MTRSAAVASILAGCGSAMAQTGLDLDRAYASELRAESDARSSFLEADTGLGLDISVMMQTRYAASFRDEDTVPLGDSDTTLGFSIPRAQIRIAGQVTDSISGRIVFDFGAAELNARNTEGSATLLEAYGVWAVDERFGLTIGQWKNPVIAEERIAAEHGLAVERSATNEFFNPGYTQGVVGSWSGDNWKFAAAVSDGATYFGNPASLNSPFNSQGENDFGITGRFDYLVSGTWSQFDDFSSWRGSNYGLRLGVGGHWQTSGETNPSTFTNAVLGTLDEIDITLWTADAMIQGDGWNVFAAYIGHLIDPTPTAGSLSDFTNHGVVVQGGFFVNEQTELFARYDAIFLDSVLEDLTGGTESDYHFLTAGFSYFLVPESHAARLTADVVYSASESSTLDIFSPVLGSSDASTTGLLGLSDSEFAVRGQMTLVF
ncbi:MAG: porin [Planctomycetota bacterium]